MTTKPPRKLDDARPILLAIGVGFAMGLPALIGMDVAQLTGWRRWIFIAAVAVVGGLLLLALATWRSARPQDPTDPDVFS